MHKNKRINYLCKNYFTKEFPGYEIENKWTLLNQETVLTILKLKEDILNNNWHPYKLQRCMGKLTTGIKFFKFNFLFWGIEKNNKWQQVAMVAESSNSKYFINFKKEGKILHCKNITLKNPPYIRKETRKDCWINYNSMINEIKSIHPKAKLMGKMTREKCSLFITNVLSHRNFCLSADKCEINNSILSQLEIEYKGRNGIWFFNHFFSKIEILKEYNNINSILEKDYFDLIKPTKIKKFYWIINHLKI